MKFDGKIDGTNKETVEGVSFQDISKSSFFQNNTVEGAFSLDKAEVLELAVKLVIVVAKWAIEEYENKDFRKDAVDFSREDKQFSLTKLDKNAVNVSKLTPAYCKEILKKMYQGSEENGFKPLSLLDISKWKCNDQCRTQILKQHAGFAAEVIGTTKENIVALAEGTDEKTFRADDLPEVFAKNNSFVDKVRMNEGGEIIERIKCKFVGNSGESCLKKLTSKKMEKYLTEGMVDSIEIPKDFYKEILVDELIPKTIDMLEKQLSRVTEDGKLDVAKKIEDKIALLKLIDSMLKPSSVTSHEAIYATKHPKRYVSKITAEETIKDGNAEGLKSGVALAGITTCMAAVGNIDKVMKNEATPKSAFAGVVKENTGKGLFDKAKAFVSRGVEKELGESTHELISSLKKLGISPDLLSFANGSFDSIIDFATGTIDMNQLVEDLGEDAAGLVGQILGTMAVPAMVSLVPSVASALAGLPIATATIGGMIGYSLAISAYKTALAHGSKEAGALWEKANSIAKETIEVANQQSAKAANVIRDAFDKFNITNKIPISLSA